MISIEKQFWTSEMVLWVDVQVTKPEDLSFIPRMNQLMHVVF